MLNDPLAARKYPILLASLAPFFLISFGLAWGIVALFNYYPARFQAVEFASLRSGLAAND